MTDSVSPMIDSVSPMTDSVSPMIVVADCGVKRAAKKLMVKMMIKSD